MSVYLWEHCIRAPPKQGRYWEIHLRCPRDFLRPKRFPKGEAWGKISRVKIFLTLWDFPRLGPFGPPKFWWSTNILLSSILLQWVNQEILPFGQGMVDSAKINPSLLMMRECFCCFCSCQCPLSMTLLTDVGNCLFFVYICLKVLQLCFPEIIVLFQFLFIFSLHCPYLCVCYICIFQLFQL